MHNLNKKHFFYKTKTKTKIDDAFFKKNIQNCKKYTRRKKRAKRSDLYQNNNRIKGKEKHKRGIKNCKAFLAKQMSQRNKTKRNKTKKKRGKKKERCKTKQNETAKQNKTKRNDRS